MPAVIGNLTQLLSVDISENEFQYLPTEIGKWVKILRSDPHHPLQGYLAHKKHPSPKTLQ